MQNSDGTQTGIDLFPSSPVALLILLMWSLTLLVFSPSDPQKMKFQLFWLSLVFQVSRSFLTQAQHSRFTAVALSAFTASAPL